MKRHMKVATKAKPISKGSQDPRSMALSTLRGQQDPQKDSLHPSLDKGWGREQPRDTWSSTGSTMSPY
jgi:hypothetical protein